MSGGSFRPPSYDIARYEEYIQQIQEATSRVFKAITNAGLVYRERYEVVKDATTDINNALSGIRELLGET